MSLLSHRRPSPCYLGSGTGAFALCPAVPGVAVQAEGVGVQEAGGFVLKADCQRHVPGCVSALARDLRSAADGW